MIDLHLHSTCSDGSESPTAVVGLAAAAGCSTIALTDHDGLAGLKEAAAAAAAAGIGFVRGCEVSCSFSPGTLHLLAYFVEDEEGPLPDMLADMRSDRSARNERLVARLRELGYPVSLDAVGAVAGSDVIGRPHFASVLVGLGAASSVQDAFDRILGKGRPAYVSKAHVSAPEAIAAAKESGAVAVLAHPLSLGLGPVELDSQIAELAELGLGGLECYYGRYAPDERSGLAAIASSHGLVATGGSDFHGTFKPGLFVGTGTGDLEVPDAAVRELEARRA